jgi:hypothetical protein
MSEREYAPHIEDVFEFMMRKKKEKEMKETEEEE